MNKLIFVMKIGIGTSQIAPYVSTGENISLNSFLNKSSEMSMGYEITGGMLASSVESSMHTTISIVPEVFRLSQAYPNPFNPSTSV